MVNEPSRRLFLAMFFSALWLILFYWVDILLASPSPVLHALI